jgi:hypothetical protein
MRDALRTIDTIAEDVVYCAACSSTKLRCEETIDDEYLIICQNCGYHWTEREAI